MKYWELVFKAMVATDKNLETYINLPLQVFNSSINIRKSPIDIQPKLTNSG
jgi:hypothetical protein